MELREQLEKVLETLSPRERELIKMKYGLNGREYRQEEIIAIFNLSRARLQQIEAKALAKLQHPCRANKLSCFVS